MSYVGLGQARLGQALSTPVASRFDAFTPPSASGTCPAGYVYQPATAGDPGLPARCGPPTSGSIPITMTGPSGSTTVGTLPRWVFPVALVGILGTVAFLSIASFTRDVRRVSEGAQSLGFFASKLRRNRRRRR